jgi:hypothetical protein
VNLSGGSSCNCNRFVSSFFFIDERLVTLYFCVCETLSGSRIRTLMNPLLLKFWIRIQA